MTNPRAAFDPRSADPDDPVYLHTFGVNSLGMHQRGHRLASPASGSWVGGPRVVYWPVNILKPYRLARWWWLNGATVGTNYLQLGIYDESINLVAASPRTLSAGTANQLQYVNPGLHATNIRSLQSNTDASSYNITSVVMKAGRLYLLAIENSHGTSASAVSSITGGGTWTSRSTVQFNASLNRVSIWSCVPTADFSGTVTVDFGGVTQTGMVASIEAIFGADTATNDGIVQNATGTGTSTTPLATLAAFGSANNGTYGAFGQAANATAAPESASYIELSDLGGTTPVQALATYWRPDNDTTVSCTITSAAWGAAAVEVKSLGTSPIMIPPMRGFLASWNDGNTATVFRRVDSANTVPHWIQTSQVTTGLPQVGTLAASAANPGLYVLGITRRASP